MNTLSTKLVAAGRMDVVQQVLANDPFFRRKLKRSGSRRVKNRRGRRRRYSQVTIDLVKFLAKHELDAVQLSRRELMANAIVCFHLDREAEQQVA
jgi:hypothetical protein